MTHWSRLQTLFDGALDQPDAARDAWLAAQTADAPELAADVRRLLAAHRRAEGVLDRAPSAMAPEDLRARLAAALADRYTIESELGRGGMATVFLAHEHKHGRAVVLKVMHPALAASWGAERFLREVRVAAQLAHPHILGVIDSGEADGLLFYVMPYVDGETLRHRLASRGARPLPEALSLLRDVADALARAHEAGVVHRDLKPENVLAVGDHAFLLDFGIAKLMGDDRESFTAAGMALGTPNYMAPEQAAAHDVDHRADLYAWGLLAYELLAGESLPPGAQRAARAELLARRPELPPALVALVVAALDHAPARRPSGAAEIRSQLDALSRAGWRDATAAPAPPAPPSAVGGAWRRTLVVGALAVAAISAGLATRRPAATSAVARGPVAVATFRNETGDSVYTTWGRLAGDWITQGLQEAGTLPVIPWPAALDASQHAERAGARDRAAAIRRETGAEIVVSGAYYLVGDRVRFQVEIVDPRQLIAAPAPVVVARDSVEAGIRLLRGQVMTALAISADERLAAVPGLIRRPPGFEAYRAFDAGLTAYNDQEYAKAATEFRRAFALDTTFHVALLYAATALYNTGRGAAADSALTIVRPHRDELSEYHRLQFGYFDAILKGDTPLALRLIRRAAVAAPTSKAPYNLARLALEVNRPREAVRALETMAPDGGALRGWSSYWTQLAHARHLLGRHEDELDAARELARRFPDRRVAHVLQARALAAMGRTAPLDSLLAAIEPLPPRTYWSQGAAMVVAGEELLAHGRPDQGRQYLERGVAWFSNQLGREPADRPMREWLGIALYDLGRWADARPYFVALASEEPERPRYAGMSALLAAYAGDREATRFLGDAPAYERGEHLSWRARIAAVRGDREQAFALWTEALAYSVDGFAWLHGSARQELDSLRTDPRFDRLLTARAETALARAD